ncbi:uncharacterized protein [Aquarana catesbeiana]|uniref:uncharacterized protein n=1 Tax=Aquarana catesbeiana TaxID=8400 RepID=UPI003CCA35CE
MQRRWKSLRDRVRRDLTDEDKAARSGAPAPTKKKHVYHTNLQFLRQNMQSHTRPTTSNFRLGEVAEEDTELQRPNSPMITSGSPRPISEGVVEGTDEESRAVETPSPASLQSGEQRGRGGVRGRGRGRQARGGYNPEADDRVLALLQEVRQERRSMDAFLDPNNPRACFCRSLYHILEDIGGDQEKLCMDRMPSVPDMDHGALIRLLGSKKGLGQTERKAVGFPKGGSFGAVDWDSGHAVGPPPS